VIKREEEGGFRGEECRGDTWEGVGKGLGGGVVGVKGEAEEALKKKRREKKR